MSFVGKASGLTIALAIGLAAAGCSRGPAETPGPQLSGRTPDTSAISAATGVLMGAEIAGRLDGQTRTRAEAEQTKALENSPSGRVVRWDNPDGRVYGEITVGQAYDTPRGACRSYTHVIYMGARPETVSGVACRSQDGTWAQIH
jgi:surface antigen